MDKKLNAVEEKRSYSGGEELLALLSSSSSSSSSHRCLGVSGNDLLLCSLSLSIRTTTGFTSWLPGEAHASGRIGDAILGLCLVPFFCGGSGRDLRNISCCVTKLIKKC